MGGPTWNSYVVPAARLWIWIFLAFGGFTGSSIQLGIRESFSRYLKKRELKPPFTGSFVLSLCLILVFLSVLSNCRNPIELIVTTCACGTHRTFPRFAPAIDSHVWHDSRPSNRALSCKSAAVIIRQEASLCWAIPRLFWLALVVFCESGNPYSFLVGSGWMHLGLVGLGTGCREESSMGWVAGCGLQEAPAVSALATSATFPFQPPPTP